jgi:hypothetical protein
MADAHPAVVARFQELAAEPRAADGYLDAWLRRFAGVADRALRSTVLAQLLEETDDGSLLGVLHRLDQRVARGDATCRWLSAELALTPSILHQLPYDRLEDLHAAARETGDHRLLTRFLGHADPGGDVPAANPHLDATPGERTAAARGADRLLLDRLMHDRDPRVITALLDNPRIVERDVVRIAAMRPTSAAILDLIASHLRWGQRYRVRKAIAFNPATPLALARPLLPTLLRQHLVELAGSQVLSPRLREEVRLLLQAPR